MWEYYQEREQINPVNNNDVNGVNVPTNCNYYLLEVLISVRGDELTAWFGLVYSLGDTIYLYVDGVLVPANYTNETIDNVLLYNLDYKYACPVCRPDVKINKAISITVENNLNLLQVPPFTSGEGAVSISMTRGYFRKI